MSEQKHPQKLRILRLLAVGIIVLVALGLATFLVFAVTLPEPADIEARFVLESTKIYDRTGEVVLYDIYEEERRTVIAFEEIPTHVKQATIAIEDQNFYEHVGIDLKAIVRAFLSNLRSERTQGGSTITQQFIKNSILSPERTLIRKVKEAILALELERRYEKDEILGFYLNQIAYGSNAYGVESASQTFFEKPARELTLPEAALLAALPKAPTYYSPYGSHVDELVGRKNLVLDRMSELGFITPEQAVEAKEVELEFSQARTGIKAPHFVFYIQELLEEKYGPDFLAQQGLKIITTVDWDLQEKAETIVREQAAINQPRGAFNAALVAVDPKTGQILSMVGSRDFFEESLPAGCTPGVNCRFEPHVNVAVRERQPGSAFKPFVYATAFEKGYTDNTILFDLFTEFNASCSPGGTPSRSGVQCYHPRNFDGTFRGPINIRTALANSINVPAVKALYLAGIDNVIRTAQDVGISTFRDRDRYGLSLVLGGAEVQLVELTGAYGVLANDGTRNPVVGILRIEDKEGNVLEEFKEQPVRVMDSQVTRMVTDILSDNQARSLVFGINNRLNFANRQVAAKTGTTNDFRDGWTFGYTPNIAVGVWAGNNDNRPVTGAEPGISLAGPIWRSFLEEAFEQEDKDGNKKFPAEGFSSPDPRPRNKAILNGEYVVDGEVHTILHYVAKDDPLGPVPSNKDPLYTNWEAPVRGWFGGAVEGEGQGGPVVITSPSSGAILGGGPFVVRAQNNAPNEVERVEFYLNSNLIQTFSGGSEVYELQFPPLPEPGSYQITARSYFTDTERGATDSSVTVQVVGAEGILPQTLGVRR